VLDLRLIRSDPDAVRAAMSRRGAVEGLREVQALDDEARALRARVEATRAERTRLSKEIGTIRRDGGDSSDLEAHGKSLAAALDREEDALRELESRRDEALLGLPNIASAEAPDGGEDDALELRRVGEPTELSGSPKDHVELAVAAGALDMEAAAAVSGARFAYLKGPLVRLQLALVNYALDVLEEADFLPVIPPVLVRESAMYGTGFFPTDRQSIYATADDDLYLVGTSEVPLAGLHIDSIFAAAELPLRYAGLSTCFRREAGAAGRDTHGIFRVHQFDKVEMFSFTTPERSQEEHQRILAIEERILTELEIPYRVVDIAVGDLGASAARKFDCEAWIPSQGRYREVTSCSNCTDYQARRLRARMRPPEGKGTVPVHTLNGTAVAVGRTIIALLENHQRDNGSVELPAPLVERGAPAWIEPLAGDDG
jgi:seryl-tRNA synthetase